MSFIKQSSKSNFKTRSNSEHGFVKIKSGLNSKTSVVTIPRLDFGAEVEAVLQQKEAEAALNTQQ